MASKKFKTLFPHLFVLAAFCLCVGLTIWQVQRMYWKEGLIEKLDSRQDLVPISADGFTSFEQDEFRLVWDYGVWDFANEMQILHQSYNGKVGTHVITPFIANSGKKILVNRGWVPYETEYEKPEGEAMLHGIIRRDPRKGHFALENEPEKNIWYNIDLEKMSAKDPDLESRFYVEAKLEDENTEKIYPLALPKKIQIYNQHMQYVITWFGLSVALLIMYYFRFWHSPKNSPINREEKA